MRQLLKALIVALAFAAVPGWAAETFPSRPIRWIVPAPPGGGTDAVGRIVGAKLSKYWGQLIGIDNPGYDALPEVPAAAESGYPALAVTEWYGVLAPAATLRQTVAVLNAGINRALASPDVLQRLQTLGMNASPATPAVFDKQIREDYALRGKVVKASGAKVD